MTDETKKLKLLIVDDEVDFLEVIAERLSSRDFDVETASSGKDALKLARKGKFDIALLDLQMPEMAGTEVLQELKKKHKFIEVIIVTGNESVDSAVECTKLGAFGYISKPYDLDKLIDTIRQAYEHRLKKKFEHDKKRSDEIAVLASGASPMGILRALMNIDDDEK